MTRPTTRIVAVATILCLVLGASACSGSSGSSSGTTSTTAPGTSTVPDVSAVAPAVAALEAKLGGPQQYYEINADSRLVNMFVMVTSADGATTAVSYTYVAGALSPTSTDLGGAEGSTFGAAALTFDPASILDGARDVLPATGLARFVVVGAGGGAVQYSIDGLSASGGQLEVVVGADGAVVEVDPV
jgi:hypothetical protein